MRGEFTIRVIERGVARDIKTKAIMDRCLCGKCGSETVKPRKNTRRKCWTCSRVKHGMSFTGSVNRKIYKIWKSMCYRCYKPEHEYFDSYGGRGISMCDEWKRSPESFVGWAIENGWSDGMQIDRIDNDDGYKPENCRIVTPAQNSRNKRSSKVTQDDVCAIRMLCWSGLSCAHVAKIFGVSESHVSNIRTFRAWK